MKNRQPEDRKAMRHSRSALPRASSSLTILLALALTTGLATGLAAPALAGKPAAATDCAQLQELYLDCHRLGQKSDSAQTCEEAARELLLPRWDQRAEAHGGKRSAGGRALAELVCDTGCEDALSGQAPATPQEFTEAFCDQPSATKPQGVRP